VSDSAKTVATTRAVTRPQSFIQRIFAWAIWLGALGILGLLGYAILTGAGKPGRPSGVTINNKVATLALLDRPAPDFSLILFGTGETLRLSDLRGKVVVLNFGPRGAHPAVKKRRPLKGFGNNTRSAAWSSWAWISGTPMKTRPSFYRNSASRIQPARTPTARSPLSMA
jgi:hypothetical protein